jgi:hypothetical protein
MTCNNWKDLGNIPWFDSDYIHYRDPVQGSMKNCGLIAALSSIASTDAGKLKIPFIAGTYKITLYNPNNLADKKTYKVKPTVPLDVNNEFCYARSKNELGEIWPPIWEKAYAAFRINLKGIKDPSGNVLYPDGSIIDQVDYTLLPSWSDWGGIPTVALTTIHGTACDAPKTLKNGCTPIYTNDQIWEDIKLNCIISPVDPSSWIVKSGGKKMVTWTHSASNPCYSYDTRIIAEHSYSIIGLLFNNDIKYIVLRNPYGISPNTTDFPWDGVNLLALGANYGIVAVLIDDFVKAFVAYGTHA